jgi:thioredoxin 1
MKNRFNVKLPASEYQSGAEAAALHVKEIAEKDFEAEVIGAALPVVLDFYGAESEACKALAPRFAAVAEKFAGKARFQKVLQAANPGLSSRLGIAASPTILFLHGGKETGERLSGDAIQRPALKARVEAMLAVVPATVPAVVPATP